MIRVDKINEIAVGLVGWRQPTKSGLPTIDAANLASRSGLYFQDANGLVRVENIQETINDPELNAAGINTYLANLSKAGLNDMLNQIFTEDTFIENRQLYGHENSWNNTIENDTSFVGYEIELHRRQDLLVVLNQITLDFDGSDTVKVLLFNSQNRGLVDSKEISVVDGSVISSLDWNLDQNSTNKGGLWYIGYLRSGLTAKAVNRQYELADLQTCFKSCRIEAIEVPGWDSETLFDINDIEYTDKTYGINLDISAFEDYTQLVLRNEKKFAKGLQLTVAANVLDIISNSTRSNRNERLSKRSATFELEGNRFNPDLPEKQGLLKELKAEIKRLKNTYINTNPVIYQQL